MYRSHRNPNSELVLSDGIPFMNEVALIRSNPQEEQ